VCLHSCGGQTRKIKSCSIRGGNYLTIRQGSLQGLKVCGLVKEMRIGNKKLTLATCIKDCYFGEVGWGKVKIVDNMIHTSLLIYFNCPAWSEKTVPTYSDFESNSAGFWATQLGSTTFAWRRHPWNWTCDGEWWSCTG
jgi:hypothetical protein